MARPNKYDDIAKLTDPAHEDDDKEYALAEPGALAEADASSEEDVDDLVMTLDHEGIDLSEDGDSPSQHRRAFEPGLDTGEEVDFRLTPEVLDKTSDPVRLYLREMGTVPLLTRQGEIDIAKRFERGHLRVLKSISRSPIVIHELLAIGAELEQGSRSIKEFVVFDEEEITDEILAAR
ncbi:MAG TPA: sigma-70 factor domain-containing protein, partial [Candidatus Limnocylindrales bacterium]|nr:sigma-70 factor domain-containing protein [Candidatus Limnocylindrales bacterium]